MFLYKMEVIIYMKNLKITVIVITICILIILTVSYIKVEILTWKHGPEFKNAYILNNLTDEIDYFKVMDYSETSAQVYYVTKARSSGDLFRFARKDGHWVLEKWETIWSRTGSADDFIWPYYR